MNVVAGSGVTSGRASQSREDEQESGDSRANPSRMTILVVDDQRGARQVLRGILEDLSNIAVDEAKSLPEAMAAMDRRAPQIVFLDIRLTPDHEDRGGFELLRWARIKHPSVPIVMVTGVTDADVLRDAMRLGAVDYITKDEIVDAMGVPAVERVLERITLRDENARLRRFVESRSGSGAILGASEPMQHIRRLVGRLADTDATVLIRGEHGSGKKLVARALHDSSWRRDAPFVTVNCGETPQTHLDSRLFGHERRAVSWDPSRRTGQLQAAGAGTLFLDGVAELPLELQAKIARVLEDRTFRPLGSADDRPFMARVLATTHADLEALHASGQLRDDLYYRLKVVTIEIPPLADRRSDIPELARAFASRVSRPVEFTESAMTWLMLQAWPGNVRELRSIVERASFLAENPLVDRDALEALVDRSGDSKEDPAIKDVADRLLALPGAAWPNIDRVERALIARALEVTGGNHTEAARILGIDRRKLMRRCRNGPGNRNPADDENDDDGA
jgi:DNA-binding NtrC family response regulator